MSQTALTYKDAGVDIDAGNALVEAIKPIAQATRRPEVLASLGGFGALFELPIDRYRQPVLVSGTDGVGTKLRLAIDYGRHDQIGVDLVAMCVNDLVVQGAEPLFFLDYYATGKLDLFVAQQVVKGIGQGCEQAGCALIGGETAEMPGMYPDTDYDLAGFCVGIVEKDALIDGSAVREGDRILGLASSGPHANGYSLIRKILEVTGTDPREPAYGDRPLIDDLMAPTRIYVRPLLKTLAEVPLHALSHITGGGLVENLPRVLPDGLKAVIDTGSWQRPAVFDWLQQAGNIDPLEMHRTFNCGIGMAVIVAEDHVEQARQLLEAAGETVFHIGHVAPRSEDEAGVELRF